jgi:lipopolysaccharide transport system ATP-binding protein
MSDVAIRVEGLSKLYRLGARPERYQTLRDNLAGLITGPIRRFRDRHRRTRESAMDDPETLWALKDVSFEIKRGEVVGVIGRNGAGKSTLLKILSRITEPSRGFAEIHGRVGSLLEVGTGFHQELSGRENIYLNGAILGMRRAEIERKFDEMVAFAEVEKFIDTPVKHYSSGMYLRLAFAVAAHLEPEILLIDEVLAVGDAAFQRKCLGKMEDVAAHGRTVLFVSHNLGVVKELCQTSVVLKEGQLQYRGPVAGGLACYSHSALSAADGEARGTGWSHLAVAGRANGIATAIEPGEPIVVEAGLDLADGCEEGYLFCLIHDPVGETVVHQRLKLEEIDLNRVEPGTYRVRVELPALWLSPGMYALSLKLFGRTLPGRDLRALSDVTMVDVSGSSGTLGKSRVLLAPPAQWSMTDAAAASGQRAAS